ncbi:MAG: hypothetical protein KatS3mg108_2235 [Isosphaeraceae bacterium]|jgi:hypothetical protein|nr:MAG: hypothetical protein KatS3mg108_2235 [Isosphaeraceae bacterium]
MRKLIPMLAVAVLSVGLSAAFAAEGQDVTITGMAQCAKCALKETQSCQNVVIAKEDGKSVKYYLEQNDVSKAAHQKLGFCTAPKDDGPTVKVTGSCVKKDDKLVVTPTKIEAVED